jgi:hypothetical protein
VVWSAGPDEGEWDILLRMREVALEPAGLESASIGVCEMETGSLSRGYESVWIQSAEGRVA